jgi:lysophospholipase L1-like esterase
MKNIILPTLLLVFSKANTQTCSRPFHIVILGSSTAAGNGATDEKKCWVYLYSQYVQEIDSGYIVDDLAVAGTTTYDAQANDYTPPPNRPLPFRGHNISAAIALHPDAIIISYPSNDAANNYSIIEQENNFRRITERAVNHHILVWVATPQPRNYFNALQVKHQKVMYDWIMKHYGDKAIDFHTGLATEKDSIREEYSAGDGIHVNNLGHKKIYNRVVKEFIPDSLCAVQPPVPIAENFMIKPEAISEATY